VDPPGIHDLTSANLSDRIAPDDDAPVTLSPSRTARVRVANAKEEICEQRRLDRKRRSH
jgi:hypothetical protein